MQSPYSYPNAQAQLTGDLSDPDRKEFVLSFTSSALQLTLISPPSSLPLEFAIAFLDVYQEALGAAPTTHLHGIIIPRSLLLTSDVGQAESWWWMCVSDGEDTAGSENDEIGGC